MTTLIAGLPATFPVPLLVTQHRWHGGQQDALAWLLKKCASLPVRSACQGMAARVPGVTVIPAGFAAVIGPHGRLHLRPHADSARRERTDGDDLLASAASTSVPGSVIGVVLSGQMHDGTEGIRAVKRLGGRVLVQDPATARARSMPASVIATGCVDFILPPHRLAPALVALAMAPGGAQLLTVPTPHWAQLGAQEQPRPVIA
jgi:two-component system, chemotaxis family, protein-glutamate methylesterase/glutaminase